MTRTTFLTFLCAAGLALAATPEEAIKQAEKDWASAIVKKDYAELNRVLADDLQYTHSDGRLDTKQSMIDSLKSGKMAYNGAEHQSIDVRMLGKDVGLVRARLSMITSSNPAPANFSVLRVYRLKGGQWQMVGHQSARLAK